MTGGCRGAPTAAFRQRDSRPCKWRLAAGRLSDDLLLSPELFAAAPAVAARYGRGVLDYGANSGPPSMRTWIAQHAHAVGDAADGVHVAAGASQALELLCDVLGGPGSTVLVEPWSYRLGLDVLRSRGMRVAGISADEAGHVTPDGLIRAVDAVRREGGRVAFGYLIPSFHNPTGAVLPADRRAELVEAAAIADVRLVEDDAYVDLWFDGPPPAPLRSLDARHVGIGTFSKTLGPGVRLGWVAGSAEIVERLGSHPLHRSGGGIAHLQALIVAELLERISWDARLDDLRQELRRRRDALCDVLAAWAPEWDLAPPAGGFFVWARLPPGTNSAEVVADAAARDVAIADGSAFAVTAGGPDHVRLAFCGHRVDEFRSIYSALSHKES